MDENEKVIKLKWVSSRENKDTSIESLSRFHIYELTSLINYFDFCKNSITELIDTRIKKEEEFQKELSEVFQKNAGVIVQFEDSRAYTEKLHNSKFLQTLYRSTLLTAFSHVDAAIGDILRLIFKVEPKYLAERETVVKFIDLDLDKIQDIRTSLIEEEIFKLTMKSYDVLFGELSKKFNVALAQYSRFNQFIEFAQRRHIETHNGGVVSNKYLDVCRKHNLPLEHIAGNKIDLNHEYIFNGIELCLELLTMFSQTLWRKIFSQPESIKDANTFLIELSYDHLKEHRWKFAQSVCEYGIQLSKSFPAQFDDCSKKMLTINLAIAMDRLGLQQEAIECVQSTDWSTASVEFQVAAAVITNPDSVYNLMRKIGINGEMINANAYRKWPLFEKLREKDEFQSVFHEIFGHGVFDKVG